MEKEDTQGSYRDKWYGDENNIKEKKYCRI